jgi:hypothetical protein
MKAFLNKIATFMAAAAFAEEGEFETARQIMKEDKPRKTKRPSARNYRRPEDGKRVRAD